MGILKLTSVRLSKDALACANALAKDFGYNHSSEVIRIALWVGLKVLSPAVLRKFMLMMFEEEQKGVQYSIDDVLRAAGVKLENLKSLK